MLTFWQDVGLVGWLTGGGHGYLSTTYGMGADNLLEASIVTPNGTLLTANPCQNSDIFFATRGGGGSTFGVVISAVVRALPTPQTTRHSFILTAVSQNATTEFWNMIGFIHSEMPRLKAGGMQGYYALAGPPGTPMLFFQWNFWLYDKPNGTAEALMERIEDRLKNKSSLLQYFQGSTAFSTYLDAFVSDNANDVVGEGSLAYGSRLLSPRSLSDPDKVAAVLAKIGPSADANKPSVRSTYARGSDKS